MIMNETSFFSSDLIFLACAVAVSFALGSVRGLERTLARQRRAVDQADRDVRDLNERCERQQVNVSRLTQELSEVRQALMQQAMAPVHAAIQATAPARAPAPQAPAPAAVPRSVPADPQALARSGASAQVLMSRCGLSRAEADLVLSVHGARKSRTAA